MVGLLACALFWGQPAGAVDSAQSAAQKLLDARSAAVNNGDKQAFLNTVDPNASNAFKAAQSSEFDGLRSLPLSKFQLQIRTDDSGDLAPGLNLAAKHSATQAYLPETRQIYRLGTYDDRDAVDSYWYTYINRNGSWYIAADDDASVIGLHSTAELWDTGAVAVQDTDHFVVLTLPSQANRGKDLGRIAEQAMTVFNSRWRLAWSDKIPIIDPGSTQEAARLLQTSADVADFSAFVSYVPLRDSGWAITAPRIYAQDTNLAQESPGNQSNTLVHELTHAATASLTGPFTPTWVQEGIAEWVRLGMPSAVNPGVANPTLPMSSDFTAAEATVVTQAYTSATSAVALIDSIAGPNGPADFFEALGSRRLNIGSPSYNVDQALQQVTGLTTAQFLVKWASRYPAAKATDTLQSSGN